MLEEDTQVGWQERQRLKERWAPDRVLQWLTALTRRVHLSPRIQTFITQLCSACHNSNVMLQLGCFYCCHQHFLKRFTSGQAFALASIHTVSFRIPFDLQAWIYNNVRSSLEALPVMRVFFSCTVCCEREKTANRYCVQRQIRLTCDEST